MSTMPNQVSLLSTDLPQYIGQPVRIAGWIHRVRQLGGLTFIVIRDGLGLIQLVHQADDGDLPHLTPDTAVSVEGIVAVESRAPGGVEIRRPTLTIIAVAEEPLPIFLGGRELDIHLDGLLKARALTLRHPQVRRIFQVQNALVHGFRQYLTRQGFTEVHTPKIVAGASESGASVFEVNYFGQAAYLAQSPQLYKQMLVGVFSRVFEVGPVFRAEPHATSRHLSEYMSLDLEMGFIQDHRAVMAECRNVLDAMLREAAGEGASDADAWPQVPEVIPVIHFSDAVAKVSRALGEDVTREPDLAPAHEAWLGEWAMAEFGSDFLFVEGYPLRTRPFYTHEDPARPSYSNSFDLLFRGQEIVTGGQRLHQYEDYIRALEQRGMSVHGLEHYLEVFRYGMPPHGGLAIGLERLTARLMQLGNIREARLFPRDRARLTP